MLIQAPPQEKAQGEWVDYSAQEGAAPAPAAEDQEVLS